MKFLSSRRARAVSAVALVLGLAGAGVVVAPLSASAAAQTFDVTINADSGAGSLRDAVAQANANVGFTDTITFHMLAGQETILMPSFIIVTEGLVVDGSGTPTLNIAGGAAGNFPLFVITPDTAAQSFTFRDFTSDGSASPVGYLGSVIYSALGLGNNVAHSITLDRIVARNLSGVEGAVLDIFALDATGSVTVQNSAFTDIASTAGNGGGSLYLRGVGGTITITGSTFTRSTAVNDGGAIYIDGNSGGLPTLTVTSTTFTGNQATGGPTGRGGAIFANMLRGMLITDSTFTGGTAAVGGGAIALLGLITGPTSARIVGSSFSGNTAGTNGGALLFGATAGVVAPGGITVDSSTFAANSLLSAAGDGYSIAFTHLQHLLPPAAADAPITIVESTFDENPAGGARYAVWLETLNGFATLAVDNSTVVGGIGIGILDSTAARINHSILWGGTQAGHGLEATLAAPGAQVALSYNLVSAPNQAYFTVFTGNTFNAPTLGLAALASNGGPTQTRLPLAGGPAHNTGNPAFGPAPAFDQRGAGFVRRVGIIDIGAVELAALTPAATLSATGGTVSPGLPVGGAFLIFLGLALVLTSVRLRRI